MSASAAASSAKRGPGRPASVTIGDILDAAEASGLRGLTRSGVAARLGVSAGTIRHHVASTNRLYSLTAARVFDRLDVVVGQESGWTGYLLVVGMRFARLVKSCPGLDDYVLHGPYEPSTVDQFSRIIAELTARDPSMPRTTAHLVGSRVLTLAATMASSPVERYDAGFVAPPGPYEDLVEWTIRAFLRGAVQLLDESAPPVLQPTPDATWTHVDPLVDR